MMSRLSEERRNRAIGMLIAGVAINDISQVFGCTRRTIHKLMARYVHTNGTVRDRQRPCRPCATTTRTDLFYYVNAFTSTTVSARRYGLSARMILNRLLKNSNPNHAHRPYKGQIMTRRHGLARVQWATRHFIWRCAGKNSDKFRFALSHADDRTLVYRRTN